MAILFQDAFGDTDTTLVTDHTPDTGDHYTEEIGSSANIQILSNQMRSDTNRNNSTNLLTARLASGETDYSTNEYDSEIKLKKIGGNGTDDPFALIARFTDTSNYYTAVIFGNNNTQNIRIVKKVAGTFTELASGDFDLTVDDILRFEVKDATKKLFINDVEKLSTTDDALTGNGVGGFVWGVGTTGTAGDDVTIDWELDDFKITEIVAAADLTEREYPRGLHRGVTRGVA